MADEEMFMTLASNDARIKFRQALDAVMRDTHVIITRYGRTEAVMVPPDFYDEALELMKHHGSVR